jgi:hypothetical protein
LRAPGGYSSRRSGGPDAPVRRSQMSLVSALAGRGVTIVTLLLAEAARMVTVVFPATVNCGSTTYRVAWPGWPWILTVPNPPSAK